MQESQPLSRRIRLFVADSSPISSQLLAEAIAKESGMDVLGFSSNPSEIIRTTRTSCLDVLVVSARMEEEASRGLLLSQQLRGERPSLKIVALLDSSKPDIVVRAFRSGASGVFCRSGELHLLLKCIAAVHRGEIWASNEELGFVLAALAATPPFQFDTKRLTPLSTRERDVVRCLVEGLTNREIAEILAISQHTVKNYIFKIFDKLGVSNRVELVFQVLSGSIPCDPFEQRTRHGISRVTPEFTDLDESQSPRVAEWPEVAAFQPRSARAKPIIIKAASST